jgi:cyclopropane-fatty-acyl-phospholipid synthase
VSTRPTQAVAARAVRLLGRYVRGGTLVVEDGSGTHRYGAGPPEVRVQVTDDHAYAALVGHGSVGLAEAYADGRLLCDDPCGLVRVLARSLAPLTAVHDRMGRLGAKVGDPIRRLAPPTPDDDRRNVRAHYDLSNAFFELLLDETMTYSCAVFERPEATLAEAQRAKLDRLFAKLDLGPDDHLVEIGTGWGGLAVHAATRTGCRVTTTTISAAQYDLARSRVDAAGVADRVTVLERDYRELTGTFDKLVSVEMVEAVDWRLHDTFFATCARLLRPGGLAALQAITIDDRSFDRAKNRSDFITEVIFPGGCIPSVASIVRSVSRATPMTVVDLEDIGRHYAETLHRWQDNLRTNADAVDALGLDERFRRLWELYLAYCEAAFLERHISDVQLVLAMPGWDPPLAVRAR